jgi:hypothetical protein
VPCALAPSGPPHRSLAGLYPAAVISRQLSTPLGVVPRSLPWQDFRPVGRLPSREQAECQTWPWFQILIISFVLPAFEFGPPRREGNTLRRCLSDGIVKGTFRIGSQPFFVPPTPPGTSEATCILKTGMWLERTGGLAANDDRQAAAGLHNRFRALLARGLDQTRHLWIK